MTVQLTLATTAVAHCAPLEQPFHLPWILRSYGTKGTRIESVSKRTELLHSDLPNRIYFSSEKWRHCQRSGPENLCMWWWPLWGEAGCLVPDTADSSSLHNSPYTHRTRLGPSSKLKVPLGKTYLRKGQRLLGVREEAWGTALGALLVRPGEKEGRRCSRSTDMTVCCGRLWGASSTGVSQPASAVTSPTVAVAHEPSLCLSNYIIHRGEFFFLLFFFFKTSQKFDKMEWKRRNFSFRWSQNSEL